MKNKKIALLTVISVAALSNAFGQCAPGVPGAGNPGCIPPDVPGSPGGQYRERTAESNAAWQDRWGAVAYDKESDHIATTSNQPSRMEAENLAMTDCRNHGGKFCKISITYHNQCIAIADGESKVGYGTGSSLDIARERAMSECGSTTCQVGYTKCSYPVRVQ